MIEQPARLAATMQIETWLAFSSIAFIATISPGPAILLVTSVSLQHGPTRSLMSIAGNVSGLFLMSSASVLGLSSLLLYSGTAFATVKFVGATYLLYLGIKLWRNGLGFSNIEPGTAPPRRRSLFSQGLLVALSNPKAIAFTTALFPQFISLSEPLLNQFAILVVTFMAFSAVCLFAYALLAHKVRHRSSRMASDSIVGKLFGSAFIGAGALLATSSQR